jgi:hypothetical protein
VNPTIRIISEKNQRHQMKKLYYQGNQSFNTSFCLYPKRKGNHAMKQRKTTLTVNNPEQIIILDQNHLNIHKTERGKFFILI